MPLKPFQSLGELIRDGVNSRIQQGTTLPPAQVGPMNQAQPASGAAGSGGLIEYDGNGSPYVPGRFDVTIFSDFRFAPSPGQFDVSPFSDFRLA